MNVMDRPPGGWNDLVTVEVFDAGLAATRSDLLAEIANARSDLSAEIAGLRADVQRELREQTWRLATLVVAAQAVVVAAIGGIGIVLRFA